jgi:hypothetical protein
MVKSAIFYFFYQAHTGASSVHSGGKVGHNRKEDAKRHLAREDHARGPR